MIRELFNDFQQDLRSPSVSQAHLKIPVHFIKRLITSSCNYQSLLYGLGWHISNDFFFQPPIMKLKAHEIRLRVVSLSEGSVPLNSLD